MMTVTVPCTRRTLLSCLLAASSWSSHALAGESIFVVLSAHSPVKFVSQKEVLALFTGRRRALTDGTPVTPVDQQRDGATRAAFYQALTGMDIARIDSYWARLHFTGQVQPPVALGDDGSVIQRLRADPTAMGYLAREPADPGVRVVLRLP